MLGLTIPPSLLLRVMDRRTFICTPAGGLFAAPAAGAQPAEKVQRIGLLDEGVPDLRSALDPNLTRPRGRPRVQSARGDAAQAGDRAAPRESHRLRRPPS
jgi:hypothetical protein